MEQRLSKLMSARGICSRREADRYIERGLVRVNGEIVNELGTKVTDDVKIELLAEAREEQEDFATILLHKPLGIVSAQPEPGYTPAITLLTPENQSDFCDGPPLEQHHFEGLAVCGRLDINSKGLLVFSQDGRIARQLIGDNTKVEKEYLVRIEGRVTEEKLETLREGLSLDGKRLRPAKVEVLNRDQLRFILREGRKRQVRRMCELVGLEVRALKRVRVGKLMLGKLEEGKWRWLRQGEQF